MKSPCMHCQDRYPGCQSRCKNPDHIEYDKRALEIRQRIAKAKFDKAIANAAKSVSIERMARRYKE